MEERKQRLSDEADRADKVARGEAEDQASERTPDDEETEDEDVFKEQQLLRQAQVKRRQGYRQIGEVEDRPLQVGWRG